MTGTPSSTAARRTRRCSTGSSSRRSGTTSTNAAGAVDVGDGGAGETEHDLGRQSVAELHVDVVGLEHALHEARPHVGVFVGATRAADQRDRRGTVQFDRVTEVSARPASRASGHEASTCPDPLRTFGVVVRLSEWMYSKP